MEMVVDALTAERHGAFTAKKIALANVNQAAVGISQLFSAMLLRVKKS
tara:strand:- start:307 stop:450 length:144 start_codon:yes stop_codon:yes gene_type:complete